MQDMSYLNAFNRGGRRDPRGSVVSACLACSAVCIFVVACAAPASAQSIARFSLDSVVAVDEFAGESASQHPQIIIDVSAAVRMGTNWQVYVRPWFRQPR